MIALKGEIEMRMNRVNYSDKTYNLNFFSGGKPVAIKASKKAEKKSNTPPIEETVKTVEKQEPDSKKVANAAEAKDTVQVKYSNINNDHGVKTNYINYSDKNVSPDHFANGKEIPKKKSSKEKKRKVENMAVLMDKKIVKTPEFNSEFKKGDAPIEAIEKIYSKYVR
jgi:hypothetical protein